MEALIYTSGFFIRAAKKIFGLCQWPCGLRRRSEAAGLLGSWVWIPLPGWMLVQWVWCALCNWHWGRLITHSEESYRICVCVCLIVYDLETKQIRLPRLDFSCCATEKKIYFTSMTLSRFVCTVHWKKVQVPFWKHMMGYKWLRSFLS
jgi:hypothetical protein